MENPIDMYFNMREGKIALAQDTSATPEKLMNEYLAILRAMHLIHYQSHWKSQGNNFYGNHLLFQRLYESAESRFDAAAEKLIGLYGKDALDISIQIKLISTIASEFCSASSIDNSLGIEKKFIEAATKIFKHLESKNELSLGLNDLICADVNAAETSVYLLESAKEPVIVESVEIE